MAHWLTPLKGLPLYEAVVPAPPGIVVDGLADVVAEPALVVTPLVVDDGAAVVVVLDVVAAVELLAAEPGRHCE